VETTKKYLKRRVLKIYACKNGGKRRDGAE
jgi:hypothetical protein